MFSFVFVHFIILSFRHTLSGTCGKIELVLYVSMYVFIDNIFGLKTELINKKSEKTIGIRCFFYTADELCNLQRYVQEYNGLKNRDDIVPFLFHYKPFVDIYVLKDLSTK